MNTSTYDRDKYLLVISPLRTDDDRDACFRTLRSKENQTLCQNIYSDKYIQCAIEQCDYVILRRTATNANIIVAFALVEVLNSKNLDILLACTIPNKERFGNMIAYDIYSFAVKKKYHELYTEPRTPELRSIFIKYGFEHFRGVKDFNEVLKKVIVLPTFNKVNKTRKTTRTGVTPSVNT
jgi:hypothetical protein